MYEGHKVILHTIKRAIQSQCFIDAYCPATVTCESRGAGTDGLVFTVTTLDLLGKLLPIVSRWQKI